MSEQAKQVFNILGIEPDEKFKIKCGDKEYDNLFHFTKDFKCIDEYKTNFGDMLNKILTGEYTIIKLSKMKKIKCLTKKEFSNWKDKHCKDLECKNCPFCATNCYAFLPTNWLDFKDRYSDKFLNQEVEV